MGADCGLAGADCGVMGEDCAVLVISESVALPVVEGGAVAEGDAGLATEEGGLGTVVSAIAIVKIDAEAILPLACFFPNIELFRICMALP